MTADPHAVALTLVAAHAASEKLAEDIVAIDVSKQLVLTDVFLLCSAANDRAVRAVVDGIEEALLKQGVKPLRREGEAEGRWVLLDYNEIVVHVQQSEERFHYALERLWRDCPVFWRHGRTAWNLENRFQGATDVPLDEVGLAQAAAAAPALARMAPTTIVSSDLDRAVTTARVLADLTGLAVVEDAGLRETNGGRWQGLTRAEIIDRDRDLFLAWVAGHDVRPPGGEVRSEVVSRVVAAVDRQVALLPSGGTLVVVSHGGSIRGAIGGLLGLAPEQWTALGVISNCAWSVLSQLTLPAEPGGEPVTRWRLEEYNAAAAPEPALGADDA